MWHNKIKELAGIKYAYLTPIRPVGKCPSTRATIWECRCDCGNLKNVSSGSLTSGNTKSCGCYGKSRLITHGATGETEYAAWAAAKNRCTREKDANFHNYGGRGIAMWEGWINNYQAFIDHIGKKPTPKHSLDRINNERGYEPGNVRWATMKEQSNNVRRNLKYTYNGETKTLTEWCELFGRNFNTVRHRIIDFKWPFEKALLTPSRKKLPNNGKRYNLN